MALRSSWRVRAIFGEYAQCLLKVGEVGKGCMSRRLGREWVRRVSGICKMFKEEELMLLCIGIVEAMRR